MSGPSGVVTNGIGRTTNAHLNLSRSMDVADRELAFALAFERIKRIKQQRRRDAELAAERARREASKIPYAGWGGK